LTLARRPSKRNTQKTVKKSGWEAST